MKLACPAPRESEEDRKWNGFVEERGPPRQAYSHSASVGRRYSTLFFFSAASAFSFFRNACASSHETFSTGKSSVSRSFTRSLPPPGAWRDSTPSLCLPS